MLADCWEWHGLRWHNGYARKGSARLHRVAWEWANGLIPAGMQVLHTCDNPPCVNPAHLFLGTHTDNMRDAAQKGRIRNRNSRKTHCPRGHEYTPENTRVWSGGRKCRACGY